MFNTDKQQSDPNLTSSQRGNYFSTAFILLGIVLAASLYVTGELSINAKNLTLISLTQKTSLILSYIMNREILLSVTASGIMITFLFLFFGICTIILSRPQRKKKLYYNLWNSYTFYKLFVFNTLRLVK